MLGAGAEVELRTTPTGWSCSIRFVSCIANPPKMEIGKTSRQRGLRFSRVVVPLPAARRPISSDAFVCAIGQLQCCCGVDIEGAFKAFEAQVAFLKAVGSRDVVVAELANAVNQVRSKSVLTDRPILNTPEWYLLTTSLDTAGKIALDNGMRLSYHPHVGTGVQTMEETASSAAMQV